LYVLCVCVCVYVCMCVCVGGGLCRLAELHALFYIFVV
jgi:hypothetical protein